MLSNVLRSYCKLLEWLMAGCLAMMVILVFGNVVLRYAFNSGITVSEEVARWLFVWLTFMGAVVALEQHAHLGTDMLVGKLGPAGKKVCLVLAYLLMLFTSYLLFRGALEQTQINLDVTAPSTGASMAIFYASGVVFSVSSAVILLNDLYLLLRGRVSDDQLIIIKESEEQA